MVAVEASPAFWKASPKLCLDTLASGPGDLALTRGVRSDAWGRRLWMYVRNFGLALGDNKRCVRAPGLPCES